jgi:HAD superfamily hydrolase (TIGR01509 family)
LPALLEYTFELPPRAFTALIFDCDGTLADSMPLHFEAWKQAFGAYGAPFDFSWELFLRRAGKTLEVTVEELNLEFSAALDPTAVAAHQRATYRAFLPQIGPVPKVVEFARERAGRLPMAVASGSDRVTVESTLELLGIRELFSVVVTAEEVVRGKPAPDLFLLAAERLGVPPSECLVFEDSPLGIVAAERAGMSAALVRPT